MAAELFDGNSVFNAVSIEEQRWMNL